ncbi:MAG: XRE family transcriptional regulator [Oscillospiraceae bacterium]|nr:XRE family transcriptional regulator [Oscillospiraceae bacterium]
MRQMEMDREQLLEALQKIAFSRPNDAVMLALDPEGQYVPGLDLWGVSEFKQSSSGAVEVKFADRVKAISLLLECAGSGENGLDPLLRALEAAP